MSGDQRERPVPGSEGAHPKPAPLRLRVHLAVFGLVLSGAAAFFTWRAGFTWATVALIVVAVLALADLIWLRTKGTLRRVPPASPHRSNGGER
ncbi:hypothetical protein AB0I28_15655 [Phytomonospora sp. NPDC050363]|uniref:hypothetical protein n=1 Tax=Phytomonospora sp. NPDC050363 TaxID=3155642 RepID=UPI0033DCE0FB